MLGSIRIRVKNDLAKFLLDLNSALYNFFYPKEHSWKSYHNKKVLKYAETLLNQRFEKSDSDCLSRQINIF